MNVTDENERVQPQESHSAEDGDHKKLIPRKMSL